MGAPILSCEGLGLQRGGAWLFQGLDLHIGARDRLALVGRNGAGKTSLIRLLAGDIEADEGKYNRLVGTRLDMLEQEPNFTAYRTAMDYALDGSQAPPRHAVEAIAGQLDIDMATCQLATASGGELRRVALVRTLASEADLLLLDEPTNHLDLAAIDWLEGHLARYKGAMIIISHDRAFLTRLTQQTLWLERGRLRRKDIGFGGFESWMESVYAEEAQAASRLDSKLRSEARWLARGVTARRRRNQGRLARLTELRAHRAAMIGAATLSDLAVNSDEMRAQSVIVAEEVTHRHPAPDTNSDTNYVAENPPIIKDFTFRVQRGDRIGIVGANGAGKTTLLKLLTGSLRPSSGKITQAKKLKPIIIDQQRQKLQDNKYVRDILADGGDWIVVRGAKKHIKGYLKEFLFDPQIADAPIASLSGGERSRLLLAREFARESSLLVLDEPTNDLDLDTLDLLQEVIADYPGTILLVSHDRDFLDRTVTVTLGLDGSGLVDIIAGGYADWQAKRRKTSVPKQRNAKAQPRKITAAVPQAKTTKKVGGKVRGEVGGRTAATVQVSPTPLNPAPSRKLSYIEQRDYDLLPTKIATIGSQIMHIETALADPDLFTRDAGRFTELSAKLAALHQQQSTAEDLWLTIAEKHDSLRG